MIFDGQKERESSSQASDISVKVDQDRITGDFGTVDKDTSNRVSAAFNSEYFNSTIDR